MILKSELVSGNTISVDYKKDKLSFKVKNNEKKLNKD